MSERFFVRKKGDALNCIAWEKSHPDLEFAVFDSAFGWGQLIALFIHEKEATKFAAMMNLFDNQDFVKNILTLTIREKLEK